MKLSTLATVPLGSRVMNTMAIRGTIIRVITGCIRFWASLRVLHTEPIATSTAA